MTAPYPALFKEAKLPSSLTMPSKNIYISSNSATPISAISSDSNTSYIASEGYSAGPISSGDPSLANYGYPLNGQQFQHDISSKSGFHGTDMSAATEMGQGLLSEIYKMQATLQQYQASIVSQQKEIERLTLDLNLYQTIQEENKKQMEIIEKDNYEYEQQVQELTHNLARSLIEQSNLSQQEAMWAREVAHTKASQREWEATMESLKKTHKNEMENMKNALKSEQILHEATEKKLILLYSDADIDSLIAEETEEDIKSLQSSLAHARQIIRLLQVRLEQNEEKHDKYLEGLKKAQANEHREAVEFSEKISFKSGSQDNAIYSSKQTNTIEITKDILSSSKLEEVDILSSDLQSSIRDVNNYGEMQRVTKVTYDISDPVLAAALTQTMIGNWMWKHTRKVAGLGISEKKHQRFFWVHPYTKTLYWNTQESGVETMDHNTKSELIDSFEILYEESSKNPSLPPSFLIKSPTRSIKIQCLDISTFDSWNNSLSYLTMDMFNIAHLNADLVEKKTTSSTFPLQSVNIGQDEESEVEESVGMPKSRPSTLSFSDPSDTILRTSQDKGKQPANTDANEMPRPNIDATQDCRSPLPVPLSTKSLRRRMSLHFMDFSFNRPNKTDPDSINYKSEKLEINTRE